MRSAPVALEAPLHCPRCDNPLDDPQSRFCPICGASVPAEAPPAAEPPSAAPSPATGARCANHPERPAVDICSRCGSFACGACLVVGADGQGVCQACFERQGGESEPMPWEQRKQLGFFRAYWETTKKIMFNPNTAFERLQPETGNWWDPLSYAILSNFLQMSGTLVVYALIFGVAGVAGAMGADAEFGAKGAGIVAAIVLGLVALLVIGVPIGAVITVFVHGGVEHLTLKLIGVPTRPFEATVRAYSYGTAPMFWGLVPFCGMYAMPVWQIVCRIFGYKAVHKTTGGKAAAGVLLPTGICCGGFAVIYAIAIAASVAAGR